MAETMRVIEISEFGEPGLMELAERPKPMPCGNEAVIRVAACGLNRADLLQRAGFYPAPSGVDPRIPGLEFSGTVESVGDRAIQVSKGDRVMGLVAGGAYAQFVRLPESELLSVPTSLTLVEAAAIPEAFLTAYRAVVIEGKFRPGDRVCFRGATSSIGLAGMMIVNYLGGQAIATGRDPKRLESATRQAPGAEWAVEGPDLVGQIRDKCPEGVDLVIDMVGGQGSNQILGALHPEGRLVLVGLMAGRRMELDLGHFLAQRLQLVAMTMRSLPSHRRVNILEGFRREILPGIEAGGLSMPLDHTFRFEQVAEAHEYMSAGQHLGKIVLKLLDGFI